MLHFVEGGVGKTRKTKTIFGISAGGQQKRVHEYEGQCLNARGSNASSFDVRRGGEQIQMIYNYERAPPI